MGQGGNEHPQGEEQGDVEQGDGDDPQQDFHGCAGELDRSGQIHVGDTAQHGRQKRHGQGDVPTDPFAQQN